MARGVATASAPDLGCGWFLSHNVNNSNPTAIGTLNVGANTFCEYRLINNLPRSDEIFFILKDFDTGSGTNDAIIFATEDNRWSTTVTREFDRLPRVIIPDAITGSRNFLITYTFSPDLRFAGTGRGFSILWGTRNGVQKCLNSTVVTIPAGVDSSLKNLTIDFGSAPASERMDRDRWVILTPENPRATISNIAAMNTTLPNEWSLNSGRAYTFGASSRVVDIYTPEPDTGNRVQIFRFNDFGLPARATYPAALKLTYFIPSFSASEFEAPQTRTASAAGISYHVSAFKAPNGIVFSAYNGTTGRPLSASTSYTAIEDYAFLRGVRERSSNVFSLDVLTSDVVTAAILLNDQFDANAALRYLFWMTPVDGGQFEIYDYLDLEGDDVGETISGSGDAIWLFTSYSAQIFGVMQTTPRAGFLPHSWIWYPDYFFLMQARMREDFVFVAGCALESNGASSIAYDFIEYDIDRNIWEPTGLLLVPRSVCSIRGQVSADISLDGSLLALGTSATSTLYVIDAYNTNVSVCVTMEDDAAFGKFVRMSANTSEVLVTGVRLYAFSLPALLSYAGTRTTCLTKADFPSSFYPSRFAFGSDDWAAVANGSPIQISASNDSINLVLQSTTENRDPDTYARRYILRSPEGYEFTYANSIGSVSQCSLGNFKGKTSFAPCQPCPVGTYQNNTGTSSCIPCSESSYCPIGSVLQIDGSGITTNVSTPRFTTADGDGPDSVIWTQLLPPYIYGWFLWTLWFLLVILGIWVQQNWNCMTRTRKLQDKVSETLVSMDPEPIEYFDPYKNDFAEQGEPKGGIFCLALLAFLAIAYIFIITFFASYSQYDGSVESIPNNVRTSNLNPYFSAPPSQKQLLDWLLSRGFTLSVRLSGYTFSDCVTLCDSQAVSSVGCFLAGSAVPCSRNASVTCRANPRDYCELSWRLPEDIDLTSVSVFSFSIANAFLQELEVSIQMNARNNLTSLFSQVDQGQDTVQLSAGYSSERVQLPASAASNEILFGVVRNYELNYAVLSSEKAGFSYQGLDWRMQAIFLPMQANVVSGTIAYNQFYCSLRFSSFPRTPLTPPPPPATSESNTVKLVFTKPTYYVSNIEKRVKNGSEVVLIAILVTTAVLDVFEVLGSLFKIVATLIGKAYGKVYQVRKRRITKRDENGEEIEMEESSEEEKDPNKSPARFENFVSDLLKKQMSTVSAGTGHRQSVARPPGAWTSGAKPDDSRQEARLRKIVQEELEKLMAQITTKLEPGGPDSPPEQQFAPPQ